ncbi:cation:proton antiporter [Marivibrio halodurans]|uniref:Cation:proton antiporter n=1 Tax=Marivibrio halodurans TaxID=2039722 RepID=A0A8J7RYA5_9PROT|nr:monovalent cation:proton antiporter-2 (CPA2) family protein [Marivibrio halodurans]MBP5856967.1 cation:proton antiporter [Marivibrio halodurans]
MAGGAQESVELVANAAVFLGAAVVAVPLFKRLGLGSILGYLAAGAVIGPVGLAVIDEADNVMHFAEFGVVLLLFVIGLELKPSRLWALKRDIFGLGLLQVLVTGGLLAVVGTYLMGAGINKALVVGFALALSSTAFGVQILRERGDLNAPYGTRAFSILLFQDLAIVPLLALVPLLAVGAEGAAPDWRASIEAVGVVVALVLAGKFLLNPVFRVIAATRSDEISVAAALLIVIGAALLMHIVGMSMALGAFIAGVMLAESEYRHQLEADIEPFRGLLLGLFFIAVGMSVDWRLVLVNWATVLGGAVGLMVVKGVVLFVLARLFGSGPKDSTRIAVTLPQGGEFGFVLFSVAAGHAILTPVEANLMTALVTVSMALTPLVGIVGDRLMGRLFSSNEWGEMPDAAEAERNRVIVVGYGRVGQVVARIFKLLGQEVTAIDGDPRRIDAAKRFGHKVYFGDATRIDVLAAAGGGEADMIFVTIDNQEACLTAIREIRKRFPGIKIMARAHDRIHAMKMLDSDADYFVRDTFESSIVLAAEGLRRLGQKDETIEHVVEEFRRADADLLARQKTQGLYAASEGGDNNRMDKT